MGGVNVIPNSSAGCGVRRGSVSVALSVGWPRGWM